MDSMFRLGVSKTIRTKKNREKKRERESRNKKKRKKESEKNIGAGNRFSCQAFFWTFQRKRFRFPITGSPFPIWYNIN